MCSNIYWVGMNVLTFIESLLNLWSEKPNMINTEDVHILVQDADAQQLMFISEFNNTECYKPTCFPQLFLVIFDANVLVYGV